MTDANKSFESQALQAAVMASVTEQRRARRWGIFFKLVILIYIVGSTIAFFATTNNVGLSNQTKEHVALVNLDGEIGTHNNAIDADTIATGLRQAFDAENSKAVILRINSPGGSPVQSAYVYDEIKRLRTKHPEKKVYAVIQDVGASGAYYIASAADDIYANKSSIVGSIGVIMRSFGFVDLMDKVGVESRTLTAGNNKAINDPFAPRDPKQEAYIKTMLGQIHEQFITAVKDGRGDRLVKGKDSEVFSGLFWTGENAQKLGLIDGFASAGGVARDVVGIDEIVDYSQKPTFFDLISSQMGSKIATKVLQKMGVPESNSPTLK